MNTSPRRQESHRVYLQQFTRGPFTASLPLPTPLPSPSPLPSANLSHPKSQSQSQHDESSSVNTTSAAVRLTLAATTGDVTELLRQKFGLLPLPKSSINNTSSSRSNSSSALDRINAHLELQRKKSSEFLLLENNKKQSPARIRRIYDPFKDDTLVIVASCFLPRGYVRFEHDTFAPSAVPTTSHGSASNSIHPQSQQHTNSSGAEAFNLFKTLSPDDNPLIVKDALYQQILLIQEEAMVLFGSTSTVSGSGSNGDDTSSTSSKSPRRVRKPPVIRLFFMPCHNSGVSNATIEMEGYCTDSEDESDYDDSGNDDDTDMNQLHSTTATNIPQWKRDIIPYASHPKANLSREQRLLMKERRLLTILSGHEISSSNECVSGYLLKQSKRDGNVWKRFHCVLPNNPQFWFVSRVKNGYTSSQDDLAGGKVITSRCLGNHSMIELNGTFLMEAIDIDSPLSGIPCTFQLMTQNGDIHTFRATSNNAYTRWIDCLTKRIVECQENSYLDNAEALVRTALVGGDKA